MTYETTFRGVLILFVVVFILFLFQGYKCYYNLNNFVGIVTGHEEVWR